MTHLPRYGVNRGQETAFRERFAEITLSARVTIDEKAFEHVEDLNTWHPLGGERRLVHWKQSDAANLWECPEAVKAALGAATRIRMVLATPAIFEHGWRPNWLDAITLTGKPTSYGPMLKLVGVINARWKAVSGWSLAKAPNPAGRSRPAAWSPPAASTSSKKVEGDGKSLWQRIRWLQSVCDREQDRRDGFGLAVWGTW